MAKGMKKEYDFSKGVRGKFFKKDTRLRFHEMPAHVLEEIAASALPFLNTAIQLEELKDRQEIEAQQILGGFDFSELIRRRTIRHSPAIMTVKELAREIKWWEASDDEYFAAQEKAEKKKK